MLILRDHYKSDKNERRTQTPILVTKKPLVYQPTSDSVIPAMLCLGVGRTEFPHPLTWICGHGWGPII